MTDIYDGDGKVVAVPPADLGGAIAWCHIMYALHALSAASGVLTSASIIGAFVFGWPSIIAVVINFLTRGSVKGTWLDSHWGWQLRSFWFAALWLLVAGGFAITLIGLVIAVPLMVATGLWVLYRVLRGWSALAARRGMPL